jgi:hypothetical protein
MYGRSWPYAEHPVTREHYCLEPVESPAGGLFPCCSFRREKPIKTSQGYAGHLASHRTSGLTAATSAAGGNLVPMPTVISANQMPGGPQAGLGMSLPDHPLKFYGVGGAGGMMVTSPSSSSSLSAYESDIMSTPTTATTTTAASMSTLLTSSPGVCFRASLQPSLPRCDMLAKGHLRFFLLPHDSEAEAVKVVFKVRITPYLYIYYSVILYL